MLWLGTKNLRGQFYDGAFNISGRFNDLQAKIQEVNKSALYVHCYAHSLNLVLVSTISLASRNFFGVIQSLYNFIAGSSKRHDIFLKMQKERGMSAPVTLKSLSDTRWACHINSFRSLNTTLSAVLDTLETVAESEGDSRIVAEANGLAISVNTFNFLLIFTIMLEMLGTINALSQLL